MRWTDGNAAYDKPAVKAMGRRARVKKRVWVCCGFYGRGCHLRCGYQPVGRMREDAVTSMGTGALV